MRELNRSGVLTRLEALDSKYLQRIFVGGPLNREVELSEVTLHEPAVCSGCSCAASGASAGSIATVWGMRTMSPSTSAVRTRPSCRSAALSTIC